MSLRQVTNKSAKKMNVPYQLSEIRCPECKKLLLKGSFQKGTVIEIMCRNNKCRYHEQPLEYTFLA